jgi:hypothetical protein
MGDGLRPGIVASGADRAVAPRPWQYDGAGWPRTLGEIRFRVIAVGVLVAATLWGYLDVGPRGRIEPDRIEQHKTDFTVFTEAGAAFFDGRNPYRVGNPRGWRYLYPPLFALLVAPLSVFDTESQVIIWYALNVGLAFGCVGEARRLWRLLTDPAGPGRSRWLGTSVGLAALLPFLDCMQAGQLGIAILYLLMVGFRLVLQGRGWPTWFLGGLILALPAVIKLVPALPVMFLVFLHWSTVALPRGGNRPLGQATALTAGVCAGVLLFLLVIPASLVGWQKNLGYLRIWQERIVTNDRVSHNANFNIHSFRNQSLANAVYLWRKATAPETVLDPRSRNGWDRPERIVHPAVRVFIGLVLIALLAVGLAVGRRTDNLDRATAYSLSGCATLLVSPLSWGHYYMTGVPAVLCVPLWLWRRGRPGLARIATVIPPILSWSYYLAMPYTGALGLLGLGTAAWFLAACGVILGIEASGPLTASRILSRKERGTAGLPRLHWSRPRTGQARRWPLSVLAEQRRRIPSGSPPD